MSDSRIVMVMAMAGLVSGCAGMSGQEMSRLQSQVGLLDERVTQLERSTIGGGFSPVSPDEFSSTIDEGTTVVESATVSVSKTSASLKPSTREIQTALKNAGFYQGRIDGKTGPVTREAIKEFQRIHGLSDDGTVGKQTWAKLQAYADLSADPGELNAAERWK